ncbi:uncharacterized protein LOC110923722 [Helianthus annuus]|uniref:uncharacterized protein LOC110923722 n=1 Tax=Helianthus annuus TaxID=4232 RepID=UPI000B9071B7|nr:uncharacterized protein LOC110923722 [Helianthus annuus]
MTLAKSVLGSLPSYFLSLFSAPKCVVKKLEKIRREFIWGKSNNRYKLGWIRWELLLKVKKAGGMGMGSIQSFNLALTKWWWRLKGNPNHLWAEVIAAIHGGNSISSSNLLILLKKTIPGIWKDIGSVQAALGKLGIDLKDNLVLDGRVWKWRSEPNGSFSVRQVRMGIESRSLEENRDNVAFDWNNWAPPKAIYLLSRAQMGKIASKVGLLQRGVPIGDSLCSRCGIHDEDPVHIFMSCLWAQCIWWSILTWLRIRFITSNNLNDFVLQVKLNPGDKVWKKVVYTIIMATVWNLWKVRNEKVFEDSFIPFRMTVEQIKEDAFLWISNRSRLKKPSWENWKDFNIIDQM